MLIRCIPYLLRETENDISSRSKHRSLLLPFLNFVGQLKSEGYDGVEAKVKDSSCKHDNRDDFTPLEN